MANLLLFNVLLSLQSFNRNYKRKRSTGLQLATKFYPYEASASLNCDENIFPLAAFRQLNGWYTVPPRPRLPHGWLPSWEESKTEFETKFPDEFRLAHETANYDSNLDLEARQVRKLWQKMLAHLEERLDDKAKYCSDPLCTRGCQALGFHGLCSLHASLFGDPPVVAFFNAFNDLCKHFDVFNLHDHQLRLYAILSPRLDDAANDRNLASLLSDLLGVRYFGIGSPYRPYQHFASAAPGGPKPAQSNSSTVDYLRDHCYNADRVPYLAIAHTDKCSLFVQLMESSCINYFGDDRSFDLANKMRGKSFPPILHHLLPEISKHLATFEAIAALYSFTCLLVEPLIPPVEVPSKEAIKTCNLIKAEHFRKKRMVSKGKDEDDENVLPAVSYSAFYRSVLTSSDPMTVKGLCLASFAHPAIKSIMPTLVSSRLLLGTYLDTFCRLVPDALEFSPSSADDIIPKPDSWTRACTYETLYRPAVLSCAATQTYLTLASSTDFSNERYFTDEDFHLTSTACHSILIGLENDGYLVEETMSSSCEELGTPFPRKLWRYAAHARSFPKYLYLAGYLDGTGWVLAAAALWPKSTWTANRLFSHLEQQGEKTPPMSRLNLGSILSRLPGVFTAAGASFTEAGNLVRATHPGYALSETYLRLAQEMEEEAVRARRALPEKTEPPPYVWPDTAAFQPVVNAEISAATTSGTRVRTFYKPCKKIMIRKNACPECGFPFATIKALKAHLSTAHPESPKGIATFKCESCEATFLLDSHRQDHIRREHPATPRLQCPQCPAKLVSQRSLEKHLELHSKKEKALVQFCQTPLFKCPKCERSFLTRGGLNHHDREKHADKTKGLYDCDKCLKSYKSLQSFRNHNHKCNLPPHEARSSKVVAPLIKTPVGNVSGGPGHGKGGHQPSFVICPKCGKPFVDEGGLKRHDARLHLVKTNGLIECDKCLRGYASAQAFRKHRCTPKGMYECNKCLRSYTRRHSFQVHNCKPLLARTRSKKITTKSPGSMLEETISDESIADDLMNEESIAEASTTVAFPFARLPTARVAPLAKVPTALFVAPILLEPMVDEPMLQDAPDQPSAAVEAPTVNVPGANDMPPNALVGSLERGPTRAELISLRLIARVAPLARDSTGMPQEAPDQPSAPAASPTVNASGANVMPPNALVGSLERGPTPAELVSLRPIARVAPLARDSTAMLVAPVPAEPMDDDQLIQEAHAQPSIAAEAPTVNAPGANLPLDRAPLEAVEDEPMPQQAPDQPATAAEAPPGNVANLAFDRTPFAPISVGRGRGGRGRIAKRETGEVGKCPIDLCQGNSWSSRKELERHYATFHCATDGGFQCPGCRRTYSSVTLLLLHVPVHRS